AAFARSPGPGLLDLASTALAERSRLRQAFSARPSTSARPATCQVRDTDWKLLCFDGDTKEVVVDRSVYFIIDLPRLLGVLRRIIIGTRNRYRGSSSRRGSRRRS